MVFSLRNRVKKPEAPKTMFHHIAYGVISICVVIAVCGSVWYVTRLPFFTISEISIEGGETISHEDLRTVVETILSGNYFLLVPHRFVYLYPHEKMLQTLREIPRVHTVTLERENRTTLAVSFDEYIPYALWCLQREDGAPCYFIDENGYAFASAPPLQGGAFTRHVIEGRNTLEKTQLFERGRLQNIAAFMQGIETGLGFRVTELTHTEAGDIVYHVNGGGSLLTSGNDPVDDVFQNLKSLLESTEFDHIAPGNFKYIDLRFGNKIFVNEELNETESTTTLELGGNIE